MISLYEVRQYDISKIIDVIKYLDTEKDVYNLLTREELCDPYCVYENLSKKDKYIGISKDELMRRIGKEILLVCVRIKINIETKKEKILDYWFE